jgi:hypothetical protein
LTYSLASLRISVSIAPKSYLSQNKSEEDILRKLVTVALFCLGACAVASAFQVPEIDPGSGVNALALIAGAVIVFRGRRKN